MISYSYSYFISKMSFAKIILVLICFLSDIYFGRCQLQEHPVVLNIKDIIHSKKVSEECVADLRVFIQKLNEDIWASKMLDATSKIPIDLVSYNFVDLGHFSQCTELESKRDNIKGKYCIGNVFMNASIAHLHQKTRSNEELKLLIHLTGLGSHLVTNITWSICLPSNCTEYDSTIIMNKLQLFGFNIRDVHCQTIENVNPKWSKDASIGISILGVLIFIILISTSYDIFRQNKTKAHPGLLTFSLYTNGKKLLEMPKRSTNLSCLDGIRVLSTFWVVMYHTWALYSFGSVFSFIETDNLTYSFSTIIIMNGFLACDTFLIVGGTLVTYQYFKKYKGDNLTFPAILKHYFHRYIRLTPALAGMVLIYSTLLKYMGSGPKWFFVDKYFEGICQKNWWKSLLYIQNEVNNGLVCVGHSWYLDVDMQLYMFSPLIFWLLSKYTKTGMIFLISATLLSMIHSFLKASEFQLSAVYPYSTLKSSAMDYIREYYLRTGTRAAPWIMGTILGYILTRKAYTDIHLPKKISIPLWILTFIVIYLCIFGAFITLRGPEYYKLQNVLYIALARPSFALAVGWIIWACSTNNGGIVNLILSSPVFQFLNKFIYSIYILHFSILYPLIFSSQTSLYINNFNLAYWFWGLFMFSFGLSIVWILVFESPMIALEKLMFSSSS